jgi:pyruvate,water dikinase
MARHVTAELAATRRLDRYLAGHPERCERRRAQIAGVTDGPALAALWRDRLEPEFRRVSRLLSAATRLSGARFVLARRWLRRLVGDAGAGALTAGSGGRLASLDLLEGLDQVARGVIDHDTFRRRYGHRGPHELEISLPRPGEDPDWLDAQLGRHLDGTGLRERRQQQEAARDAAWQELRRRHPAQARVLGPQLTGWARASRRREDARSEVTRYFWVLRDFVLRAGALTGLGDDAFFLEAEEILGVLGGAALPPGLVRQRRAAYAGYARLPPYPGLVRGPFDPFGWAADPHRRTDVAVPRGVGLAPQRGPVAAPDPAVVTGFPGSAGVVEGTVRVLADAAEGDRLQPGEVLVTTTTNVGWTPLFPRVAAVVTDVGAPLSHAAIVARELGIPAVVGCRDATMRLHTGDRVRVDGAAGTVERLENGG